ncbi:hypothetical protein HDU97_006144 [Phlyctochytrium planicorne]|nr:hypothetical protein HDU97_006144 [Phlyctochytrium planicorne]
MDASSAVIATYTILIFPNAINKHVSVDKMPSNAQMVLRLASVAGIYESILKSRRESLHQLYAEYYENAYESTFSKTYLSALLHHLMKLPEQDGRKLKPIEAQMYYDILKTLEARNIGMVSSNLEIAREHRHLALLHTDAGRPKVAEDHYFKAFRILGCNVKRSNFHLIIELFKCASYVSKVVESSPEKQRTLSLLYLLKLFPASLSKPMVYEYLQKFGSSKTIKSEEISKYSAIFEAVEEIRWLTICAAGLLITTEMGFELGFIEFIFYFSQIAKLNISRNDLALANVVTSAVLISLSRMKLGKKLQQLAVGLYDLENATYFPTTVLFVLTWIDFVILVESRKLTIPTQVLKAFRKLCKVLCSFYRVPLKPFDASVKVLRGIERDGVLRYQVTKKSILYLISWTKCSVLDTDVIKFLPRTELWRSRIMVRVVKLAALLKGEEREEILEGLRDSIPKSVKCLASAEHLTFGVSAAVYLQKYRVLLILLRDFHIPYEGMILESLLARRLRALQVPDVPSVESEVFGCVAVIDISGYTRLTDQLAALGGIDRIRDVLNPPFELIIKTVHRRFGSVIKLAGDSAIVTWTVPAKFREDLKKEMVRDEEIEKRAKELVCNLAIMCCIELLESFADYEIKIENLDDEFMSGGRLTGTNEMVDKKSGFNLAVAQNNANLIGSIGKLGFLNRSTEVVTHSASTDNSKQRLQLHIGLGFGSVQHVFVGNYSLLSPPTTEGSHGRAEYFVAGKALHDAGIMLGSGKSGQLFFRHEQLKEFTGWPTISRFKDKGFPDVVVVELQNETFLELKGIIGSLLPARASYDWSEEIITKGGFSDRRLRNFIEPSLLKHIPNSLEAGSGTIPGALPKPEKEVFSDNVNQFRTITVLFLRLPKIPIDDIGNPDVMQDVEFAAQESIKIAAKHGGTCRQIHADEKALSALLVWGVEGFSHEKGNHGYAISAGMELKSVLAGRSWMSDAMKEQTEQNFSIAITMGKA